MSTPQEYWDACLIKTWRENATLFATVQMFESITGMKFSECKLLRIPHDGYRWKTGVRAFVAGYLHKINDRLWNQPPEKDVLLLRKLATSTYTTAKTNVIYDSEYKALNKEHRNNREIVELRQTKYYQRNRATDWGVTKGAGTIRKAK